MQCSFCDFWPNGVAPREELTLTDFARIARELSELGTFLVSIEGGEPFVRPDLVEIVALFARRHIPLLYTNGWYVDEAKARALLSAGLAQVGVSIDYADAASATIGGGALRGRVHARLARRRPRCATPRRMAASRST